VGNIALEISLRPFTLGWSGQRSNPADARIEALGDPLDDASLAGGIASFENDHELELMAQNPVLQLDQLALEAEQLLEIDAAINGLPGCSATSASSLPRRSSSTSSSSSSSKLSTISAWMRS
jgi:hypothetical protein